ncbi:MAG TPA: response regulator [Polyangiaceae bacterium]|nr:response regulator [Polyangiaceae bacterium]
MSAESQQLEQMPVSSRRSLIWLVEDSPLEAELARRALPGCEIEVFIDGPSMLERRSTHGGPSILILDWQLPGMSGLEICRFLRASLDEMALPILMLTVQGNKADIVEALSAGANDYLTKPYDAAELSARVGSMGRTRRLYEDLQLERERLAEVSAERERLLSHAHEGWTRAEGANRVKDDFLAVVSHELRTPLNAIAGWVSLLRGGLLSAEKSKHALDTIARNARSQTQLIDDLLDVSRIISGKLHVHKEVEDFEAIVRLAHDAVEPTARAKRVAMTVEVEPGHYDVCGDAGRLQQVVWNLLNNAVKFTPEGGLVRLELKSEARVSLTVSDSGRGIDSATLPFIFDRFRQAEGSMTRRAGGLGLGLAIVKHLIELHGGTVRAESPGEGLGATFTIELEHVKDDASLDRNREREASSPHASAGELRGVRVLVVDDDDDSREMLEHLLVGAGARLRTANSVEAALTALDAEVPDILVSDIGMPNEDGLSLIKRIRLRTPARGGVVPAVALTAYARGEDRAIALRAGFNSHVSKPIDSIEVIAVIASACGRFSTGSRS